MVHIEHIALWTENIDRLAALYATYFGASIGPPYTNSSKGYESRFLSFEHGARLELMKTTMLQPAVYGAGVQRVGFTHLPISVGAKDRVDELTGILRKAGFAVVDGPRSTGDGYYESVVLDPDGNRLELTV